MNIEVEAYREKFWKMTNNCVIFCFMSRDKEYQIKASQQMYELEKEAVILKDKMINVGDEDSANAMLSFENMSKALSNELKMWVALKEDNTNMAWDLLIDAQMATITAMQAHEVAHHLQERYLERLYQLEKLLFPGQMFFSPGIVITYSECSICGSEYGECDHVVGRPYMGSLCVRNIKKCDLKEISLVENPANKKARIFTITDDGVKREFLTWRILEDKEQKL